MIFCNLPNLVGSNLFSKFNKSFNIKPIKKQNDAVLIEPQLPYDLGVDNSKEDSVPNKFSRCLMTANWGNFTNIKLELP
jgi:hypothetical protein